MNILPHNFARLSLAGLDQGQMALHLQLRGGFLAQATAKPVIGLVIIENLFFRTLLLKLYVKLDILFLAMLFDPS